MSGPTEAGRYEWTGSQLVITHCIHGLDLRLNPRCYLCRPVLVGEGRQRLWSALQTLTRMAERAENILSAEHDGCEDAGVCFDPDHAQIRNDLLFAIAAAAKALDGDDRLDPE